jgi:hypothetical protein
MLRFIRGLLCSLALALGGGSVSAQCDSPIEFSDLGNLRGPDGPVRRVLVLDTLAPETAVNQFIAIGDFRNYGHLSTPEGVVLCNDYQGLFALSPLESAAEVKYFNPPWRVFAYSSQRITVDGRDLGYVAEFLRTEARWEPFADFNGPVTSIESIGSGMFFKGEFTQINGQQHPRFAALIDSIWSSPPLLEGAPAPDVIPLAPGAYAATRLDLGIGGYRVWLSSGATWSTITSTPTTLGAFEAINGQPALTRKYIQSGVRLQTRYLWNGTLWNFSSSTWEESYQTGPYTVNRVGDQQRVVLTANPSSTVTMLTFDSVEDCAQVTVTANRAFFYLSSLRRTYANDRPIGYLTYALGALVPGRTGEYPGPGGTLVQSARAVVPGRASSSRIRVLESALLQYESLERNALYVGRMSGYEALWDAHVHHVGASGNSAVTKAFTVHDRIFLLKMGTAAGDPFQSVVVELDYAFANEALEPVSPYVLNSFAQIADNYCFAAAEDSLDQSGTIVFRGSRSDTFPQSYYIWSASGIPPLPYASHIAAVYTQNRERLYASYIEANQIVIVESTPTWTEVARVPALTDRQIVSFQGTVYVAGVSVINNVRRYVIYQLNPGSDPTVFAQSHTGIAPNATFFLCPTHRALYLSSSGVTLNGTNLGKVGRYSFGSWQPIELPVVPPNSPNFEVAPLNAGVVIHGNFTTLPNGVSAYKFAYLADPVLCISDQNCDGGVDGADIEAFFQKFFAGTPDADVNQDGGVDGSDVETFYTTWATGLPSCQ